ncbi:MAG: YkgJ family cysteine cluster protein [Candidatus Heimdallarchaeota archaeon]|nr:MAG: YkgJ family cysteine cluster protein [Candidatus Heimdallarchaeota archaeon]
MRINLISLREKRFKCQQSGNCCCDPNIIVTLTYRDLFQLFITQERDFRLLLQKISFYTLDSRLSSQVQKQMVLNPIQTTKGKVIPGLKKLSNNFCIFFKPPNCVIYSSRPLACRNYPLAFIKERKEMISIWAKDSQESCPGIGKGTILSTMYIKRLGKQFFKETEEHNKVVKELNIEASQGRPLAAREALWVLVTYGESKQSQK